MRAVIFIFAILSFQAFAKSAPEPVIELTYSSSSIAAAYSASASDSVNHLYGSYAWRIEPEPGGAGLRLISSIKIATEATECDRRHILAHEMRHHNIAKTAFLSAQSTNQSEVFEQVKQAMQLANPMIDDGSDQARSHAACGNQIDNRIRTRSWF